MPAIFAVPGFEYPWLPAATIENRKTRRPDPYLVLDTCAASQVRAKAAFVWVSLHLYAEQSSYHAAPLEQLLEC